MGEIKVAVLGNGKKDIDLVPLKSASYTLDALIRGENTGQTVYDYDKAVGTLFRCVRHIARALSSMPRQVERIEDNKVIAQANFPQPELDEDGNLLSEDILPFEIQLTRALLRVGIALMTGSEAFLHLEKERGFLRRVVWQDPRLIKPIWSSGGLVRFEKQMKGRPLPIPPEDMCYIYLPGISETKPDIPPAQVAMEDAGLVYHQKAFLSKFFEGGAMPTTLFFADDEPPPEEKKRLRDYLYRAISGRMNAWGIDILSRRLHFEHLVPPLREMALREISSDAAFAICVAMGVPISVVYTNASRNSTSETDDLHFYTKTIIPYARDIEEVMNDTMFNPLGLRLRFRPDKLEVFEALEYQRQSMMNMIGLTPDEQRVAAGYAPHNDDFDFGGDKEDDDAEISAAFEEKATRPFGLIDAEWKCMQDDLALWERKVIKQWGKSHPLVVPFKSDYIPPAVEWMVRHRLSTAASREEVKAAFAAPFRVSRPSARSRVLRP